MITKRIIPCLDVRSGRVVKGTNFEDIRDGGRNTGCGRQVRLEHPFHGREAGQRGWGLHEKDTFRRGNYGGKLYFLRWVGEQPDKFRLFLYGGNLLFFLFGSLIPLDCFRIVQNCCKLCMFRQQVVFIWHGSSF